METDCASRISARAVARTAVRAGGRPAGVRLFCTDLDGTLLGDRIAMGRFTATWQALPDERRPLLVYNTGRTAQDVAGLVASRQLPRPDYVIGAIGTELDGGGAALAADYCARFEEAWNRAAVDAAVSAMPRTRQQPLAQLNPHKSSWFWEWATTGELASLQARLGAAGVAATLVYSCRLFLDVVPRLAGKGQALTWLCGRLGIALGEVVVAGDTGNDAAMFALPGVRGIVVGNALPELLRDAGEQSAFTAPGWMADGVIQGLQHYGVLPAPARRPAWAGPATLSTRFGPGAGV